MIFIAWKETKFGLDTRTMANKNYQRLSIGRGDKIVDEETFDAIKSAMGSTAGEITTQINVRDLFRLRNPKIFDVVLEKRKDGKWHLLGLELGRGELEPKTSAPIKPGQPEYDDFGQINLPVNPLDYRVTFLRVPEPIKSELCNGIIEKRHLIVEKD